MGGDGVTIVADDIVPSRISSSWGGFTMRTDWRSSHPSTARRHPILTLLKPDSVLMLNRSSLTIVTICKERERKGTARVEVFSGGGTVGTARSSKKAISIVPRTTTSPCMDIIPSNSTDRAGQVSPTLIPANTASLSPLALLPHTQGSSNAI